ncbi:MAG: amidohydrolase family protein [Burkholderiales bacterium]
MLRPFAFISLVLLLAPLAAAADLPIFDAHIHYSHDTREALPEKTAISILRKAGVRRALVSSSDDDGTQALYREAPDLIIPELRPYRVRPDISTWMRDDSIVSYVEERLKRYRYVAIGEFHVYGADADLPVVRRMVQLARERKLFLHMHSDGDAVERVFKQDPEARVLWAHAGFAPPGKVREMLRRYQNLWCELSWRTDHAPAGKLNAEWRPLFLEMPDRFMVGTDTPSPERWHYVVEHARLARSWLSELPGDIAEKIAWRNGEALFGPPAAALKKP